MSNAKRVDLDLLAILPAKPGLGARERKRRLLEAFLREGLARGTKAVGVPSRVVRCDTWLQIKKTTHTYI